jgi:DNA adenine methylase
MRAFLRWAGGKSHIINKLLPFVPKRNDYNRYWEPFLGSGAMYFALAPKKAILADLNRDLINCYREVRTNPRIIASYLNRLSRSHSKSFYLQARNLYNRTNNQTQKAALFIYLNKASFNGIFRVNKKGFFNVPYGHRASIKLPKITQLHEIKSLLDGATLIIASFEETLKNTKRSDFIFLDPPYPPINGTSFFTHYTKERFGLNDQKKVHQIANELNHKGCLVMVTNTDLPLIRDLYKGWNIRSLPVTRWLTCKLVKQKVTDLIITNYDLEGI